ncbi:MAG: hypothetical protein V1872_09670 [bacterium]
MVKDNKWLIDNTALSNFAIIKELNILSRYFRDKLIVTKEVVDEFYDGITKGRINKECNLGVSFPLIIGTVNKAFNKTAHTWA